MHNSDHRILHTLGKASLHIEEHSANAGITINWNIDPNFHLNRKMLKRYLLPLTPRFFLLALISLGVAFIIADYTSFDHVRPHHLKLQLQSSEPTTIDLYYDLGHGFAEYNRQSRDIDQANQTVQLDFSLPAWEILHRIRLDTNSPDAVVTLSSLDIIYHGEYPANIDLTSGQANTQLEAKSNNDGQLVLQSGNDSNDPFIVFNQIGAAPGTTKAARISRLLIWGVSVLVLLLVLRAAYRYFILGR